MATSSNFRNPFLARVLASNDERTGSSGNPPNVMSSTQSIPSGRRITSVGVRRSQRHKTPLRDIASGLIQTIRPGVKPVWAGRSPAHTVWISKNQIFAITGFHTEVFDITDLSVTASKFRASAALRSPDGTSIAIKPDGPAWIKFFEHISATHPNVTINRRVWAIAGRPNDTYEYFER